jgi:hypothetical protein
MVHQIISYYTEAPYKHKSYKIIHYSGAHPAVPEVPENQ